MIEKETNEKLLIDAAYEDEVRIAVLDGQGKLEHFEAELTENTNIKGNIYLAKVVRIEPALQAAFIDYGGTKHGFIALSEIRKAYFNQNIVRAEEEKSPKAALPPALRDEYSPPEKKQYKIQEVINPKQVLLVQAIKEVRGNKCAAFTTYISLPGRYCVLLANSQKKTANFSKKISESDKERLKEVIDSLDIPEGLSLIVRTAGENRTKQEIRRDFDYLLRLWNEITEEVMNSVAPKLIFEEGNIIKRTIRDLYKRTMDEILIEGTNAYKEAKTFMKLFTPSHVKKIKLYADDKSIPIFHKYSVESKIAQIMDTTVILPSGGSVVINSTEALTAIDVNSGKMKQERDIEDTALKTNLEAAVEIARQMELRDIAGLIVIDFIDMETKTSIIQVEKTFKDAVKNDYSNIQIGKISQFGLLELSRQRLRPSLSETTFVTCPHCSGTGKVFSDKTICFSIIRKIEAFIVANEPNNIIVELPHGLDYLLLNKQRRFLSELESKYSVTIEIIPNNNLNPFECNVSTPDKKSQNHNISEPLGKEQSKKPRNKKRKPIGDSSLKEKNVETTESQIPPQENLAKDQPKKLENEKRKPIGDSSLKEKNVGTPESKILPQENLQKEPPKKLRNKKRKPIGDNSLKEKNVGTPEPKILPQENLQKDQPKKLENKKRKPIGDSSLKEKNVETTESQIPPQEKLEKEPEKVVKTKTNNLKGNRKSFIEKFEFKFHNRNDMLSDKPVDDISPKKHKVEVDNLFRKVI